MSLADKIALCSGANFWYTKSFEAYGILPMMMCDGPHGIRKQECETDMLGVNQSVPATCFPPSGTTAASWDATLTASVGEAIAKEAAANGVGVFLGPGANLKRNPLCGRNFEYYSEDPYLAGKLAAGYIKAAQKDGIGCSLKHFAGNNQEYKRFSSDSVMDERTLREMYLTAFEIAVKEGAPKTVMSAYNKINGVHCSSSKKLLTDILRDEWGFKGLVMTDWGGISDRIEGFRAGCDLIMPGGSDFMEKECAAAVKKGILPEHDIDDCAARVLKMVFEAVEATKGEHTFDRAKHHDLARMAAEQSAVLLKNAEAILPLTKEKRVGLIGHMAEELRYQGAGSSYINPTRLISPKEALSECPYVYCAYAQGTNPDGSTNEDLIGKAAELARTVDIAVVFAGLPGSYESEGFDRKHMRMPEGQIRLIEAMAKVNENLVVVLFGGGVMELPWEDKVKGILYMALPGQAGGEALANLLYGQANPCGKLAESWPLVYEDCPSAAFYGERRKDGEYREGIYVGYRYYQKAQKKVRYPFGFGLSYTKFRYSDIRANQRTVTVVVTNTGEVAGAEAVQLYVSPPAGGIHRPLRELKGFDKIFLQPGESKKVTFELSDRSFAVWQDGFRVVEGTYRIEIGKSSEDLPLHTDIQVKGEVIPAPSWQAGSWYEQLQGTPSQKEWEKLLGHPYTPPVIKKGEFTMEHSVMEMKEYSLVMKVMFKFIEKAVAKGFGGKIDYTNPTFQMMISSSADSSLCAMQVSGGIKGHVFAGMLALANGHWLRGIRILLRK